MAKQIGLDVPTRTRPGKTAFSIRPRKVAAWIEALPRANLGETARQLFTVLHETNQYRYPVQDRIRFLEAIREPLHYVTNSLKKHFVGVGLPLPEKNHNIASITRELFNSMATGYKIALEDTLARRWFMLDKQPIAILLHRCLRYSSQHFLAAWQAYSPVEEQHWAELHKLYRFAEQHRLLKRRIRDEYLSFRDKTSLATEYSRILLLSLASPCHLRQGEVGKVHDALERWLHKPIIRPLRRDERDSNKFVDNLARATAPIALSLSHHAENTDLEQLRVIETEALSRQIEHELEHTTDSGASTITTLDLVTTELSRSLLQRLQVAWGVANKRFFPRQQKHEQVKITIGLTAAHQFITRQARNMDDGQYVSKYDQRAHFESTELRLKQAQDNKAEDVWGVLYPKELSRLDPLGGDNLSLLDPDAPEISETTEKPKQPQQQFHTDNWVLLNESIKGLMLNNQHKVSNKAQVGELVSIHRHNNGHAGKWHIGVIRWLKQEHDNSLQMGLEILNPDAAAIGIRAASTPNAPLQRSLMLPELKNLKQPASLILNPVPWREGNRVMINMLGKEVPARLGKIIQSTGLFSQFEYRILADEKKEDDNTTSSDITDFQQIWSSI